MQRDIDRAFIHLRQQVFAIGPIDRDDGNGRLSMIIVQVGRAPDCRADAPVDIDAGVDEDRALRAFVLEVPNRRRAAKAIDNYDLTLNIDIGCRREIEEVDAASSGKALNTNSFSTDAASWRADRKARRFGAI